MPSILSNIKKLKFYYYSSNILSLLVPHIWYRNRLAYWKNLAKKYSQEDIKTRVNYYINTHNNHSLIDKIALKDFKKPNGNSQYFFDLAQITKYFNKNLKIRFKFGDVTDNQKELTIVKSRPIKQTGNSVIMKLDKTRHFNFVKDNIDFEDKKDFIVWRGWVAKHPQRNLLINKFSNHPLFDVCEADSSNKEEYLKNSLTIPQQLNYKFILSIEGNDVATNLKWILNSNSLCFMPTPVYETWFMEGKLIPDFHYVHIKSDFSDLVEKIEYYKQHTAEAKKIIKNGNKWVEQFKDEKLEKIISLLTLDTYFRKTNQY